MPKHRRTYRRSSPRLRKNRIGIYAVALVLAFSLLIWAISLIPAQVWGYLLIIVVIIVLAVIIGGVFFLVHRGQERLGEEITSPAKRRQRNRTTTRRQGAAYQQGYRADSQSFWQVAEHFKTRGDFFNLNYTEFEDFCGHLLEALGYTQVERVGGSGDRGIDLRAISPDGKRVIAQCKQHNIGIKANSMEFQKLVGAMGIDQTDRGIFFTTSLFTSEVISLNNDSGNKIRLIDGQMLVQLTQQVLTLHNQQKGHS